MRPEKLPTHGRVFRVFRDATQASGAGPYSRMLSERTSGAQVAFSVRT